MTPGYFENCLPVLEQLEERLFLSTTVLADNVPTFDPPVGYVEVVKIGDLFKYRSGTSEPSAKWKLLSYNSGSWYSKYTGIGYGVSGAYKSVLNKMDKGYISFEVRKSFSVTDAASVSSLVLGMQYDDGFVAYLNGVEIARSPSMGDVTPKYNTPAGATHEISDPEQFYTVSLSPGMLTEGKNMLAIEVHNNALGDGDAGVKPRLFLKKGAPPPPPPVNTAPTAVVSAAYPNGQLAPAAVQLDGSKSTDKEGAISSYTWNFGDGSAIQTTTSAVVTHTYSTSGDYTAMLTVTDSQGALGQATTVVSVLGVSTPPPADNVPILTRPDGYTDIVKPGDTVKYFKGTSQPGAAWIGGGTFDDSSWLSGATGIGVGDVTYATTLTDMVDNYMSFYARKTFNVTDPAAVKAMVLGMQYDDGFIAYINGVEVARSPSMGNLSPSYDTPSNDMYDEEAPTEYYQINITPSLLKAGDNVLAIEVHNCQLSSSDAAMTPTLMVQAGASTQPANTAPTAAVSASYPNGTTAPASVTLDGSKSADAEGAIASYTWNFGDGSAGQTTTTPTVTHTYAAGGTYTASLAVKDSGGLTATATTSVVMTNAANGGPTAAMSVSYPAGNTAPATLSFDASKSSDAASTITSYTWDFGDGTDSQTTTTPSTLHAYAGEGSYTAKLTVTDAAGAKASTTCAVALQYNAPTNIAPTAVLKISYPQGAQEPATVTLDGGGSSDPNNYIVALWWDFGDGSASVQNTSWSMTHTYAKAGNYTATLRVIDQSGAKGTDSKPVVITAAGANTAPTASVTVGYPNGSVAPASVTLDGSKSTDAEGPIASYTWDFGDGSAQQTTTTATVSHTYAAGGNFTATLTVKDSGGLTAQATTPVALTAAAGNTAPTAIVSATYPNGSAIPATVQFDASKSSDKEGPIASYTWDYGDGSAAQTTTTPAASHVYTVAGSYTATLTVKDSGGLTAQATTPVTVAVPPPSDLPPVAVLTIAYPSGNAAPAAVTLDGGQSYDPDNYITSLTWDYGDGSAAVTNNNWSMTHTYSTPGTYTAKLTVTDQVGVSNTTSKSVVVAQTASNTPPNAVVSASYPNGQVAPVSVTLDGSKSTDKEGPIASYTWDFGDGSTALTTTAGSTTHTYAKAGSYTVTLTAKDSGGLTASATTAVTINAPANQAPTAVVSVTYPNGQVAPVAVMFDGSKSTDPEGPIASYTWNFGDGSAAQTTTAASVSHTYSTPGTHTATLTVKDSAGATGQATTSVVINSATNTAPTAVLSAAYPNGQVAPVAVTLDGSKSTDKEGPIASYTWNFGDGSAQQTTAAGTVSHTYATAGTYTASLTVTDSGGATAKATAAVTVTPAVVGNTYYVSKAVGSSDSNAGTIDKPFATMAKAASVAMPGDTVMIRGGTYSTSLVPGRSGTASAPITYRNYGTETVTISGPQVGVDISNRSYVVIQGLNVTNVSNWLWAMNTTYCLVQGNTFTNNSDPFHSTVAGVYFQNSQYNRVLNNTITNSSEDSLSLIVSDKNLIEGNNFRDAYHTLFTIKGGQQNILRNNYFYNGIQKMGEIYDAYQVGDSHQYTKVNQTTYNVVENNTFAYCPSSGNQGPFAGIQYAAQHGIIRNNVFYDTVGPALDFTNYSQEAEYNTNNRVYNNDFSRTSFAGISLCWATGYANTDNVFKNNILQKSVFVANDTRWAWYVQELNGKPVQVLAGELTGYFFDTNAFWNSSAGEKYLITQGVRSAANPPQQSTDWWNINHPELYVNNINQNPAFVNDVAHDFHLTAGSPMIDTGTFVTATTSAGSGTTMTVKDAGYFIDGFGIPGEVGDMIQLQGTTQTARILKVNYATNQITLDRSLTWTAGQGVARAYAGSKPDLGAFEYGTAVSQAPVIMYTNLASAAGTSSGGGTASTQSLTLDSDVLAAAAAGSSSEPQFVMADSSSGAGVDSQSAGGVQLSSLSSQTLDLLSPQTLGTQTIGQIVLDPTMPMVDLLSPNQGLDSALTLLGSPLDMNS